MLKTNKANAIVGEVGTVYRGFKDLICGTATIRNGTASVCVSAKQVKALAAKHDAQKAEIAAAQTAADVKIDEANKARRLAEARKAAEARAKANAALAAAVAKIV